MSNIDTVDVGVDTGGTFTDLVFRFSSGRVQIAKVPSTPSDPGQAVLEGIVQKAREWNIPLENVRRVVHGTTVATNAIIERKGSHIGLITTEGFRDVLEIGRQMRQEMYNLRIKPVTPAFLVPRARRLEVPERLSAKGEVLVPLDERAVVQAAERLVAEGVQAIAVCFLFSSWTRCTRDGRANSSWHDFLTSTSRSPATSIRPFANTNVLSRRRSTPMSNQWSTAI